MKFTALLPLCGAIGTIIGPLIGGYLSNPPKPTTKIAAKALASSSREKAISFSDDYPYLLPCLVAGATNLIGVLLGALYLKETLFQPRLHTNNNSRLHSDEEHEVDEDHDRNQEDEQEFGSERKRLRLPTIYELCTKDHNIMLIMTSFLFFAFQNSAWATLLPLFAYTRIEDGGLGLQVKQIGAVLATNGIISVLVQTAIFPYLQRRIGTLKLYRTMLLFRDGSGSGRRCWY